MQSSNSEKTASFRKHRDYIAVILSTIVVVLLMGLITYGANRSMDEIQQRASTIVERNFAKLRLIEQMRISARERTVILQRMAIEEDPFKRDEDFLLFNRHAFLFGSARNDLHALGLNTSETRHLIEQSVLTDTAVQHQDKVIELIDNEDFKRARDVLINFATPAQNKVLAILDQLSAIQIEAANDAIEESKTSNNRNRKLSIVALFLATVITAIVAVLTLRVLARSNQQKEQALHEIERANNAKSSFVANMSHEIRTPLTAIIGFSEAALDPTQSPQEHETSLSTIARSSKHLLNMLNGILDLAKIEAEKLQVEKEEVSVVELINDVANILRLQAEEKGLEFSLNYNFPIPRKLVTDPVRVKQILLNLGGNAIKFTSDGRIDLNVDYDTHTQRLTIDVVDTGIGLSSQQIKNLFAAFVQAESDTTRKYGGTGLGLHLSRQLAQLLGGTITVKSEVGSGSCFTLTIYAIASNVNDLIADAQHVEKVSNEQSNQVRYNRLSGTVLIAEDSRDNQVLLKIFFAKIGINAVVAENGKQAVEYASNNVFDLILMDMQMPIMDGIDAVRLLRRRGYSQPIVAVTANALIEDRENCLKAGCNDFLSKPITFDSLYRVVSPFLKERTEMYKANEPMMDRLGEDRRSNLR